MILCILPPARQKPQTAQTRAFSQLRPVQQFANFYICSYSNNTDGHRFNTDVARSPRSRSLRSLATFAAARRATARVPTLANYSLRIILYFVKSGRGGIHRSPPSGLHQCCICAYLCYLNKKPKRYIRTQKIKLQPPCVHRRICAHAHTIIYTINTKQYNIDFS